MRTDKYGQIIYSERDLCEMYMRHPDRTLFGALVETPINISTELDLERPPQLLQWVESDESVEEFDRRLQGEWRMPQEYKNLDIAQWVLEQCTTDAQLQRVGEELLLYVERDLFPLLQYLKYLVDTLRSNGIVWGVGRGSSVSSYVLYLIGVHRIDSMYYDLDVREFLR